MSMKDKSILAVGAHPDDMDFTSAGTIARFIEEGAKAYYLICTDGSRGSSDPEMTHEKLSQVRRDEQLKAADILGVEKVFFLDHQDTQLLPSQLLQEQIVRHIRMLRPTMVFTMNPTFYYAVDPYGTGMSTINHTDHRAVGLATMDAVFPLCRDRLIFPEHEKEGLLPHKVSELYFPSYRHEHLVDITTTFDKKLKAIEAHQSQYDSFEDEEKRMRERAENLGREKGYALAESFVRLLIQD